MTSEISRTCELCGRPIKRGRGICECGVVLRDGTDSSDGAGSSINYGALLPWLPLIGVAGCIWLIMQPSLVAYSWMPLIKIYGVVAILSATVVMLASAQMDALGKPQVGDYSSDSSSLSGMSPVSWFLGTALAWPVYFPMFVYEHYRRKIPTRTWIACAGAALFLVLLIYCIFSLRSKPIVWPAGQATDRKVPEAPAHIKQRAAQNPMPVYPQNHEHPSPLPTTAASTQDAPALMPNAQSNPPVSNNVPPAMAPAPIPQAAGSSFGGSTGSGGSSGGAEPTVGISIPKRSGVR